MMFTPEEYAEAFYRNVRGLDGKETGAAARKFVGYMESRGLKALLPAVMKGLPAVMRRVDGVENVLIESAHEINPDLAERAAGLVSAGGQVEVEVRINPELLGGLRVRGRNMAYDASLRSVLATLREKLVRSS